MNDQFFELDEVDNEEELLAFDQEDEASDYEAGFDAQEFGGTSEEREIEMAAELLSVSDEQELDQFLGRIMRGARNILNTPAGSKLRDLLKQTAGRALPLAGQAIGGYIGGDRGAAFGGQLASAGGRLFGLETEGLSPEDNELQVARRFVRLAGAALQKLSNAPANVDPARAARNALLAAAQRHAPGLASQMSGGNNQNGKRRKAMHDLDRTLRSQEPEMEGDFEEEIFGESESDFEEETSAISEEEEINLAAELLAVTDDRELDQFLGGLLKKARNAVGPLVKKYLKPIAKKIIPIAGTAIGGYFGGPMGAKLGGKLGSFATTLFEVDFESMDPESQDMEVARNFVRFANAAASNAATASRTEDPNRAAKTAIVNAAKVHAPGLLRNRPGASGVSVVSQPRPTTGRWIRRRGRIVLLGV